MLAVDRKDRRANLTVVLWSAKHANSLTTSSETLPEVEALCRSLPDYATSIVVEFECPSTKYIWINSVLSFLRHVSADPG